MSIPEKKPRTLEESAKAASRRFLDPKYDSVKEPKGLTSGKTSKSGNFVSDEKDKCDE